MLVALNIFYYIIIFIMGTIFGSFFTLAVYRIPLKKDITHERSFCPNCNHKLGFLDLIPVWSYIFLRGKCRYCGQKIRPRYLILEILSGTVFLIAYISFKITIYNIDWFKLTQFIFFVFTYITLIIIGFIDKEHHMVHKKTLLFGYIIEIIHYIVNITVFNTFSIYNSLYNLALLIQLTILTIYDLRNKNKNKKDKKNKNIKNLPPISFYTSLISILAIIIMSFIINY